MDSGNKSIGLSYGVDPKDVYISEDEKNLEINQFKFSIQNTRQGNQIKFINTHQLTPDDELPVYGQASDHYKLSWFYVWFPWGNEEGDLASKEASINMTISPDKGNELWYCVKGTSAEIGTYWTLFPKKDTVIDPQESIGFIVDNLISQTPVGMTCMYIKSHKIPGFEDEKAIKKIWKYHRVRINDLSIDPSPVTLKNQQAHVTVNWDAQHYEMLTLAPFYKDVTNEDVYKAVLSSTTEITLMAMGKGRGNIAYKSVKAEVLPSINSFSVMPKTIYYDDFPHDVDFVWDIDTNDTVKLSNEMTGMSSIETSKGKTNKTVESSSMWSIQPNGNDEIKRSALIQAFKIKKSNKNIPARSKMSVPSPTAQFIASIGEGNKVNIISPFTGELYCEPIEVGQSPVDLKFSSDGKLLVVANQQKPSLSLIKVLYDENSQLYKFNVITELPLDGQPSKIIISNNCAHIFVTTSVNNQLNGYLEIFKSNSELSYTKMKNIVVGKNPNDLILTSSEAQIIVANQGEESLSIIGYDVTQEAYTFIRTQKVENAFPTRLALAGREMKTLLVACKNSSVVYAYDSSNMLLCQKIDVAGQVTDIAATKDGAYAYVTCKNQSKVVLLNVYLGVPYCRVLETLNLENAPTSIKLTQDGYMAYISNNDNVLSTLNFENYEMDTFAPKVCKFPNRVTTSTDGKLVVSWSDLNSFHVKGATGNDGIHVYRSDLQMGHQIFTETRVSDFLFYPDTAKKKAFLLAYKSNNVSVVDINGYFKIAVNIPIPRAVGGIERLGRRMGLSQNGKTLFVLALTEDGNASVLVYDVTIDEGMYTFKSEQALGVLGKNLLFETSLDGSCAFVVDVNALKMHKVVFDGSTCHLDHTFELKRIPCSVAVSPNNDFLYILEEMNMSVGFEVINIQKNTIEQSTLMSATAEKLNLQKMCISSDGKRLFISDSGIVGVRVVSTSTLRIIQTLSFDNQYIELPYDIAIVPNDTAIFLVGYFSNTLACIKEIGLRSNYLGDSLNSFIEESAFEGFFVRDYIGETPSSKEKGKSWTTSPDIIINGINLLPDPDVLLDQDNYNKGLPKSHAQTPLQNNYVYYRAINTSNGEQNSTLYMYYVDTSIVLWPQNWKSLGISRAGEITHAAPLKATKKGEIVSVNPPFQWEPPRDSVHYCLTAWIQNDPMEQGEPNLFEIGSVRDMAKFILDHKNVSWLNTIEHDMAQPTIQDSSPVVGPEEGGAISLGVRCDVPAGGFIEFSVPGTTKENTIIYHKTRIDSKGLTVLIKVIYPKMPGGFKTNLTFTYYKADGQKLPDGSKITPIAGMEFYGEHPEHSVELLAHTKPQHILEAYHYDSPAHVHKEENEKNGFNFVPLKKVFLIGSVEHELKEK